MPVLDRFKDAGVLAKTAFVTLLAAALFVWIAYTCTGWGGYARKTEPYKRSGRHVGLWRSCSDDKDSPSCSDLDGWGLEWFSAVQAFVTFGFLGINLGLFLVILYIFTLSCLRDVELGRATAIVCCVSAGLYMIGVIIFAVRYKRDYIEQEQRDYTYGYCFFLSILAILLDGSSGVFMFLESRLNGQASTEATTERQLLTGPVYQINPTYGVNVPSGSPQICTGYMIPANGQQPPAGNLAPMDGQQAPSVQASAVGDKQPEESQG